MERYRVVCDYLPGKGWRCTGGYYIPAAVATPPAVARDAGLLALLARAPACRGPINPRLVLREWQGGAV